MKKIFTSIAIFVLIFISQNKSNAQCPYDNTIYLTGPAPTTVGAIVTAQQTWGGDFNRVTGMQAGYTYEISTCNSPTFDSEITIYPSGGGTALAYDDDGCGTMGGPSKVLFTPTSTGDYDILLDEYNCIDNSTDMDMDIKLVSTGGTNPGSINIPVVVHVVYKNSTENVSNAQIMSQIDALNRDYRKQNADFANAPSVFQPLGADMDVTFCLATFDPNGNSTTGITRTQTSVQGFSTTVDPKSTANGGHDNWDPTKYLNLWVCDLTGTLLGFATFPADLATAPNLDGVVIDYSYFGTIGTSTAPFDLGRTATHEVGHWLNLRHIWGDANCGDDFVNDTPTQQQSNGGCPNFPHVTCNNGPNGDLYADYMDYTDDACMMMFTLGQKQRTDATLSTTRNSLHTSGGCGPQAIADITGHFTFEVYPNPSNDVVSVFITGKNNSIYNMKIYNVMGAELKSFNQTVTANDKLTFSVSGLPKGMYILELSNDHAYLNKKLVVE